MELYNTSESSSTVSSDSLTQGDIYYNKFFIDEKLLKYVRNKSFNTKINKITLVEIFLNLKNNLLPETYSLKQIRIKIKSIFSKRAPEDLCETLSFICCEESFHTDRCAFIWKLVKKSLLELVDMLEEKEKPIFSINKRQSSRCSVLLDTNQPSWVHRIYLESVSIIGKIE